jgi:hypothetical protein
MDDKQDFIAKLKAQEDVWKMQLAEFQVQADSEDEMSGDAYYNMINNLKRLLGDFEKKLEEVKNSDDESFETASREMEDILESTVHAFGEFTERFKSNLSE